MYVHICPDNDFCEPFVKLVYKMNAGKCPGNVVNLFNIRSNICSGYVADMFTRLKAESCTTHWHGMQLISMQLMIKGPLLTQLFN